VLRRDALREYTRGSLWVLPAIAAVGALVLGIVLSRVPVSISSRLAFQGTADDARSLLITIAATMVTVIALLLGLAVVALQLSSTQFSPRLLRNFLRDRPNQVVLGVFVGTFVYSAAGLFDVGIAGGQRVDQFPRFAVTVAMVLMFLSLALLVFFADHLAHSLQVDHIMSTVEKNTLTVIRALPPAKVPPPVPADATPVPARVSGYVQYVAVSRLLAFADRNAVNVYLRQRVGEHLAAGTALAWIWPVSPGSAPPPAADVVSRQLHAHVRVGFERTLEQDPGLGMRQLVDTACKALSPAVNDPYTAIQAVHHLSALYNELARRRVGTIVVHGPASGAALVIPARSIADHLDVGMGLIRRYGAREPTVVHAMLSALSAVLLAAPGDSDVMHAVEHQAGLLVRAAERHVDEPGDLRTVRAENEALRALLDTGGDRAATDRV
jgi:uncharacterized membrane protein